MRPHHVLAVVSGLIVAACSDDPAGPNVGVPELTFSAASVATPFLTAGSTVAPTIAWNGGTGTVALVAPVTGVSVDATTGVVSWDGSLPIGANTVDVVATNSAGSATASLTIESEFQGRFVGGYNNDPGSETTADDFEMTFNVDGTMSTLDGGLYIGTGTWTRVGVTVTAVYTYNVAPLTVQGDVTHSATEAVLEGFWYWGDTATSGDEAGYLRVVMTAAP
jgi:hypothetical protein